MTTRYSAVPVECVRLARLLPTVGRKLPAIWIDLKFLLTLSYLFCVPYASVSKVLKLTVFSEWFLRNLPCGTILGSLLWPTPSELIHAAL